MTQRWIFGWIGFASIVVCACGGEAPALPDASADASTDAARPPSIDAGPLCERDRDCDDGRFCDGVERCMPGAEGADARGCIQAADPCASGETCNEETDACDRCTAETRDRDGDGYVSRACGGDDCDDDDAAIRPGATEICDPLGVDEDCRPETLGPAGPSGTGGDADGDSFVSAACCRASAAGLVCGDDCDDANREINPDASEICNGVDDNCDGSLDPTLEDRDRDGWAGCADLPSELRDCDDGNAATWPGAPELCDGRDNDCDGTAAGEDLDGDSFLATDASCTGGPLDALPRTDCDDSDSAISPVASERCDAIDHDCDGTTDEPPAADSCPSDAITTYACSAETCTVASCAEGNADCDGVDANGCEQPLSTVAHCGACGNACEWTCTTASGPFRAACDDPVAISAGAFHVCARLTSGRIRCWGRNDDGQLGLGSPSTTPSTRPAAHVQALGGFDLPATAVESGAYFNCARVASGNLYCWGRNDHGQLGNGVAGPSEAFARSYISGVYDSFAVGETHACAIRGGFVDCWGDGRQSQCGLSRLSPVVAPQQAWGGTPAVQVALGAEHTCLRTTGGEVYCWGGNTYGQVGDGTTSSPRGGPGRVRNEAGTGYLSGIVEIACGAYLSCARNASGRTVCWGGGATLPRVVQTSTTDATPVLFSSFFGDMGLLNVACGLTTGGPQCAEPRTVSGATTMIARGIGGYTPPLRDVVGSLGSTGSDNVLQCMLHGPGTECMGLNGYGEVGNGTRTAAPRFVPVLPPAGP